MKIPSVDQKLQPLLKGWIWPIGEASAGEGLRLQPAQQACLTENTKKLYQKNFLFFFRYTTDCFTLTLIYQREKYFTFGVVICLSAILQPTTTILL